MNIFKFILSKVSYTDAGRLVWRVASIQHIHVQIVSLLITQLCDLEQIYLTDINDIYMAEKND